jgi:hypothetical protein
MNIITILLSLMLVSVTRQEIRKELKDNTDDIILESSGREVYSEFISGFVIGANPQIESSTVEFKTLMELFANHLMNYNGKLIADDYNLFARRYNVCRELARTIDNTWLPAVFKTSVRKYYAIKIISEGMNIDLSKLVEWVKAIPTEGNIVYVQDKDALSAGKNGVLTSETDLATIVGNIHPGFRDWPPESKAKVVDYVAGMNPYILTTLKSEVENDKNITKSYYNIVKGEPIWIPAISYLKK